MIAIKELQRYVAERFLSFLEDATVTNNRLDQRQGVGVVEVAVVSRGGVDLIFRLRSTYSMRGNNVSFSAVGGLRHNESIQAAVACASRSGSAFASIPYSFWESIINPWSVSSLINIPPELQSASNLLRIIGDGIEKDLTSYIKRIAGYINKEFRPQYAQLCAVDSLVAENHEKADLRTNVWARGATLGFLERREDFENEPVRR